MLVPGEHLLSLDLVAERGDQLRRPDAGPDANASAAAVAVEVGGDDELLVGEPIGRRDPRARPCAHLELSGLATPDRDAVGKGERQRGAGVFGRDLHEVDMHVAASRDISGTVADPGDVATVRAFVMVVPAHHAHPKREVGRQFVCPAAQHVALVEDRSDHACQPRVDGRRGHDHVCQTRMQRECQHRSAGRRRMAGSVERAEMPQEVVGLL